MAWNLVAPNTWKNDRSDFLIEYDSDYSQYVVKSIDGRYIVPFDDIFNNPVFPVDLSQVTVPGKHFRAEGSNSPGTPGFSFQGDANTGIYRISEDKIGFSANGIKQGEFGIGYGGFTGNIIQVVQSTNTYKQSIISTSYTDLLSAVGTVWETSITPKYNNSKILIVYSVQGLIYIPSNTIYYAIGISKKISGGSYAQIFNPSEKQFGIAVGGGSSVYNVNQWTYFHLDDSNTTSQINYKLQAKLSNASGTFFFNDPSTTGAGTYTSTVTIMEIQQ